MRKILTFAIAIISTEFTYAQLLNNDFEQQKKNTFTEWNFKKNDSYDVKIDSKEKHSKNNSLQIIGDNVDSKKFQAFSQKISINVDKMQKIEISAYIKSENLTGHINLFTQIKDANDNLIAFGNSETQKKFIPINQDWTKCTLEFIIDEDAKNLVIGGLLSGKGNAWFDDFEIKYKDFSGKEPSEIAKKYIEDFKNIVQKNSIFSDKIDWQKINNNIEILSKGMESVEDTDIALYYILKNLKKVGDKHSFIESKENFEKRKVSNPKGIEPEYQLINNNIGYIMVPGFNSANKEIANNFAEKIQNMIKKLDSENNIKGWVVDLRKNTGGNMYPMIAGLGSLVGEGNLGYFVAKNRKDTWKYENGKMGSYQYTIPPKINSSDKKIAILIGKKTRSSGEATAIAFIGKNNVKLFGQPSGGFTSANRSFRLSDGKSIALAVSFEMDRTGKEYRSEIIPDVIIKPDANKDLDLETAQKWILE